MANIYKNRFSEEVRKYLSDDEWLHVEENYDRLANYENESIFALTSGKMMQKQQQRKSQHWMIAHSV